MAHHQRNRAPNKKNSGKAPNFAEILAFRGCFLVPKASKASSSATLATQLNSSTPSLLPPSGRDLPFQVDYINNSADKQVSWVHKAWTSVCNVLPKQGAAPHEEVVKPNGPLTESSLSVKCSHENKLEGVPSLGKHILLYMSEKSLIKGHVLCDVENSCACNIVSNSDGFGNLDDESESSFVGVFLQNQTKDGAHLASRLVDGGWARRGLHSMAFARLRGEPGMICASSSRSHVEFGDAMQTQHYEESTPLQLASSSSSFHRLSLKSFRERMVQLVPHHHQPQQLQDFPDKEMLNSVQDFFMYTEYEGKKVFEEFDRDADGKLTLDDMKLAMQKMKLPVGYAKDFMRSRHWLWPAKYFGWSDFSSLLQEKEPVIVRLFNSLGVSKSGMVKSTHVKDSLLKAGLSATEANVAAMMKFLAEDVDDGLKYGQFRRFMLLLPTEQLTQDPWSVWLKAATTHGVEPLSDDLQLSVCDHVTSVVPRNLSHHLGLVKGHF